MSIAPDSNTPPTPNPTAMMRLPVGAVSPLWGLFAGAAVTGAAWWWMTRWARPENLEAMFGAATKVDEAVLNAMESAVAALPEPVVEAPPMLEAAPAVIEPVVETAAEIVETVADPVVETLEAAPEVVAETLEAVAEAPAAIAEALAEVPELAAEPVGGESAPISPVVAALAPEVIAPMIEEPVVEAAAIEAAPVTPKPAKRKSVPKVTAAPLDEG